MSSQKPVLAVLTSGGDSPGMNAAIRSCTLAALQSGYKVIGFTHGYYGILQNKYIELHEHVVRDIIHCGGTILKSARCPEFKEDESQQQAAKNLEELNVKALIVIGGDGSFNGLIQLSRYYKGQVIGLPGTIDNDIDGTDYTIGFATAVETAIEAVDKIRDTADAFERIFIVEVMGRHSGFLALNVGIASGAEQIITFENFINPGKELKKIAEHISLCKKQRGMSSYLIVAAENLWPGGVYRLAEDLGNYANIKCTPCVLGYIQRGGNPLAKDRILATKLGVGAIRAIDNGKTMLMIAECNRDIKEVSLAIAVGHTKTVNKDLLQAQESVLDIAALAKQQVL
ncbi:ATP-dependent 6-phosphofructokinase [Thalassotalea sp. HSM 43]|uniref:6-phosphofructokinase n=1 Tax=Thalassotalea sp. HSM 43 TaxID=2552945 RepID=UPI0010812EB0|nr:ATP-dependent 6-phosphofructokinase [Thalassotalea sp. HSM 43]QBY06069.1 ATP-dependent 6-phosphofructokinase [Thalassotalea sp. HSM 43]